MLEVLFQNLISVPSSTEISDPTERINLKKKILKD